MTTITIDTELNLPQTHFKNLDELLKIINQLKFEKELLSDYKKSKNSKKEDFINI